MIQFKVLVVDDEDSIRNLLKTILSREGREVLLSSKGRDAVEVFLRERPDITILDLVMPDMNGIEVLRRIRAIDPYATVMVFTGAPSESSVRQARELGVTEFPEKGSSLSGIRGLEPCGRSGNRISRSNRKDHRPIHSRSLSSLIEPKRARLETQGTPYRVRARMR